MDDTPTTYRGDAANGRPDDAVTVLGREWRSVHTVLGDALAEALTGVDATTGQRFASGELPAPRDVAARVQFVAHVNVALAGSYTDEGIRRWWQRPRQALGGRSPLAALGTDWDPDTDTAARHVRSLAETLTGATPWT